MTLRTPRRRISPRTKRRYRAIRDFLRRALGTASQPDTKTNSNISVSVADLKHQIGVEEQLDQISQHCQKLINIDDGSTCEKLTSHKKIKNNTSLEKIKINPIETKVLYKTSESQYKNFVESDVTSKFSYANDIDIISQQQRNKRTPKINGQGASNKYKIRKCDNGLEVVNEIDSNVTSRKKTLSHTTPSSSLDLVKIGSTRCHEKRRPRIDYVNPIIIKESQKNKEIERNNNIELLVRKYEERITRKKLKHGKKELDKDFITDIIKRQYKPVKFFKRRESSLSQLSAPLCRDQDFSVHENIQEGSALCSCCYDKPTVHDGIRCTPSFSDMRSICDTKLYSSKRYPRIKQSRRNQEYYNDSLYDLVPVKEKSSPKSRRKFADCNMIPYDHYKEVPPSPRSLRPRLNLTAQRHNQCDDFGPYIFSSHQKNSIEKPKVQKIDKNLQNDLSSCMISGTDQASSQTSSSPESQNIHNDNDIDVSFAHNLTNLTLNDLSLNKTQETNLIVDKTDKALYEIKDILQTFLEEMKKETLQTDKSDTSDKSLSKRKQEDEKTTNIPKFHGSSHSFNNISNQCVAKPYIPAFPNSCCYPVLPMCPINCVQNGFVIPTQSHACMTCTNNHKEPGIQSNEATNTCVNANNNTDKNTNEDTQQLIKAIYNLVTQTPGPKTNGEYRDVCIDNTETLEEKPTPKIMLTSRSAGASSNHSVHDVQVGTSQMKCYSKSCEAFSLKKASESIYNASYSDTILEKISLEAAATQPSEFDFSSILNMSVKPRKKKKFSKVLQSFGNLLKKRKKDVIEELSESDSTVEEDVQQMSPYRQQVTSYMMHGEEYYQQPPIPPIPQKYPYQASPQCTYLPSGVLDSRLGYAHSPYTSPIPEQGVHGELYQGTSPSYSNSFDPRFNQVPPQVPLCLKEIEVKSIGTQSEQKKSFFETLRNKMAVPKPQIDPIEEAHRNVAQMTKKPGLLNWRNLQEKAMQTNTANMGVSFKNTQRQLAETDMTIRNTLIKRFFHKRNPFSPQNPLLQTLLGKDKPMEEPANLLRTRMLV